MKLVSTNNKETYSNNDQQKRETKRDLDIIFVDWVKNTETISINWENWQ